MVFALNLLFSIFCSVKLSYIYGHSNIRKRFIYFFLLFMPLWGVWLIICGGQYGIGADYFSYYEIFEECKTTLYYNKNEWLFASIVEVGNYLSLPPQFFFVIFYFINFYFFLKILYELDLKYTYVFVVLYICLSTVFNNQLNGLRQYTAIYIITYAIIAYNRNKSLKQAILWIIMAGGIHGSAFLALPLLWINKIKVPRKQFANLLLISVLLSVIGAINFLTDGLRYILPPYYLYYLDSEFNRSNNLQQLVGKYIFIPFYFLSTYLIKNKMMTQRDESLYKIGFYSFCIRIVFLDNFIFNRVGQSFILLSTIPIYMLMKYSVKKKYKYIYWTVLLTFIAFYFMKVIVLAKQEYLYQSIYFQDFE